VNFWVREGEKDSDNCNEVRMQISESRHDKISEIKQNLFSRKGKEDSHETMMFSSQRDVDDDRVFFFMRKREGFIVIIN
jgi:histone acetyltransferase (RNA polymerase elongator complex component)